MWNRNAGSNTNTRVILIPRHQELEDLAELTVGFLYFAIRSAIFRSLPISGSNLISGEEPIDSAPLGRIASARRPPEKSIASLSHGADSSGQRLLLYDSDRLPRLRAGARFPRLRSWCRNFIGSHLRNFCVHNAHSSSRKCNANSRHNISPLTQRRIL